MMDWERFDTDDQGRVVRRIGPNTEVVDEIHRATEALLEAVSHLTSNHHDLHRVEAILEEYKERHK